MKCIINASKEGPNRLVEVLILVSYILEVPGSNLSPGDSMSNYTTPVSFNVSSILLVIAIQ